MDVAARVGGAAGEGHLVGSELVEFDVEIALEFLGEASAGATGVDELAVVVDAEQERAEAVGSFGGVRVAADDEFLLEAAFGFEPVGAAAGAIGCVALRDNAFGLELAGFGKDGGTAAVDVLAEAEGAVVVVR